MTELKAFIVEDSPVIRENLSATLQELAGVTVIGDADGEQVAKSWLAANSQDWDLAIVDIFLKEGSGLGVLEYCRERQGARKVVVLSNYVTPLMRRRCAALGADAVFDKSTEIENLIEFCQQYGG